jgi:Na+-translocating ferredoxin:NAD+ oxidoreductase RnfC subunit
MHIGAPSVLIAKAGESVVKGQKIAEAGNGLSVALHAPISGVVKLAGNEIVIEAEK